MNKPMVEPAVSSVASSVATAKSWHIASRWQEFEGEMRSAVLRALLVVVFYAIQLVHYLTLQAIAEPDRIFHRHVTMAAIAWLFLSISILIALRGGFMPPILKYISTAIDLSLVTLLAWLSHGPSSPLVLVLFLVLAISALRFRIGLIWFATSGAMASYMLLVGSADTSWFDAEHVTPLLTQAITLCSIASTGMVLGQIVRTPRRMADAFLSRVGQDRNGETA
ncbi:MAG: hypothetical protein NTY15_08545 [Planctomycetota bacterium]|nr:hypothetical protein [Planctomycetota bacterium]